MLETRSFSNVFMPENNLLTFQEGMDHKYDSSVRFPGNLTRIQRENQGVGEAALKLF